MPLMPPPPPPLQQGESRLEFTEVLVAERCGRDYEDEDDER